MVTKDKINVKNYGACLANYIAGINKGLLKIMSKMGISCISSYRGAQLFEIVGLNSDIVDLCFTNTTSRIRGPLCTCEYGATPEGIGNMPWVGSWRGHHGSAVGHCTCTLIAKSWVITAEHCATRVLKNIHVKPRVAGLTQISHQIVLLRLG